MQDVYEVDAGEMYEVDLFKISYDPATQQFCWVAESGCSCWEGYGTLESPSDFDGAGTAQEAHQALDAWAAETTYHTVPADQVADAHLAIASVKPYKGKHRKA